METGSYLSEFVDGLSLRHEAGKHGNHDGDSGGDSSSIAMLHTRRRLNGCRTFWSVSAKS